MHSANRHYFPMWYGGRCDCNNDQTNIIIIIRQLISYVCNFIFLISVLCIAEYNFRNRIIRLNERQTFFTIPPVKMNIYHQNGIVHFDLNLKPFDLKSVQSAYRISNNRDPGTIHNHQKSIKYVDLQYVCLFMHM